MAEMREAKSPEKRGYSTLHHIEIEKVKGPNGGHMVTHHYQGNGSIMEYKQPTKHMFGKEDGEELIGHLRQHLGIKGEPDGAEAGDGEEY